MKDRVCIFIDGGNFYHLALKKLKIQQTNFDFEKFSKYLAISRIIPLQCKRYYIGTVREREGDSGSKEAMAEQTKLFSALKKGNWEIKTSKLRRRLEEIIVDHRTIDFEKIKKAGFNKIQYERWREKGIDVKIATDLIVGALDDKYDTAIVISSDSDLIPAIDWVRNRTRKKIEYVGFSIINPNDRKNYTKPLLSMISRTDIQRIITESDLRQFVLQPALSFNNN